MLNFTENITDFDSEISKFSMFNELLCHLAVEIMWLSSWGSLASQMSYAIAGIEMRCVSILVTNFEIIIS